MPGVRSRNHPDYPLQKEMLHFPRRSAHHPARFPQRGCGTSCTGIQNQDIFVKLLDKGFHLCLIAVIFLIGISPCCHVIPAGATGCFRIGSDHPHTILCQIIPVLDILRISLPNKKYNGGSIRSTVIRIFIDPSLVDQTAFRIASISYSSASVATSAGSPLEISRACFPEPP